MTATAHTFDTEPGPYPPGEGPADYTECRHCGRGLDAADDDCTGEFDYLTQGEGS